jgi:hypothetical protein
VGSRAALSRTQSAAASAATADVVRHDDTRLAADQAVATASLRTLGTGAQQAAPGNDSRLSDPRSWSLYTAGGETSGYVPTWNGTKYVAAAASGGGVPTTRLITAGTGLTGGGDLTADRTLAVAYGQVAGTALQGSDRGAINGVAPLDASGDVPVANLPDLSGTYIAVSQKGATNGVAPLTGNIISHTYYQGATTSTDGSIVLAGDLTGTYSLPKLVGNSLRAVTGNATIADTDGIVIVTPSGSTATATLPTPVGRTGKRFIIKKAYGATAFSVSIATAAGTIDGNATELIMVAGGYRELVSDGSNWHIIGGTVIPVLYSPTAPTNGSTVNFDCTMASVFRFTPAVAGWILGNPTNGIDGLQVNVEITPSTAFVLTITGPALTTGLSSTVSIASGKKCFIGLRYSGSTWYVLASTVQQ